MNYLQQAIEATQSFDRKELSIQDWVCALLGEEYNNIYSDEYARRAEKIFSMFVGKLQEAEIDDIDIEDIALSVKQAQAKVEQERMKLADERREYKEEVRWKARNELFQDRILEAIQNLEPINIPACRYKDISLVGTTAVLGIADIHAGSTFEVKGLYDEIVNKYDYDIMTARFWELLQKIENEDIVFDNLVICLLGDLFENILRLSSLTKLREPVVDTVIRFGEFISIWVAEAQRRLGVPIRVVTVGGNHDICRVLGSKPQLEEENLTKIVVELMKLRLKDCPDIVVADYTDVAIENVRGTNLMLQHGEDKDLQTTVDYFSNLYNVECDEIWAGHLHHPESKTIGITEVGDRQVVRIGSMCGLDPYSKKIRAAARPSAYIALYTDEGKGWNKNIYL